MSIKIIRCVKCGDYRRLGGFSLCTRCYSKLKKRPIRVCSICKKFKEHMAFGLCAGCYRKLYLKKQLKGYGQKWRKEHHDKMLGYGEKRRKEHPERIKELAKIWHEKNPTKKREYRLKAKSKRRAIIKGFMVKEGITKQIQDIVWNESNGCCIHCGKVTSKFLEQQHPDKTTYDHIIGVTTLSPKIHKFNPNGVENLGIACWDCNVVKRNNKTIEEWYKEMKKIIPEKILSKLNKLNENTIKEIGGIHNEASKS